MPLIKYVGRKAKKQDNVAGTGIWWLGHGDVREVPDSATGKLLAHPDVWALADVAESAGLAAIATQSIAAPPNPTIAKFALQGPAGEVTLDPMDDAAVKTWVAENLEPHGIKVDGRLKGDKLKQAVIDAVKAATTEG